MLSLFPWTLSFERDFKIELRPYGRLIYMSNNPTPSVNIVKSKRNTMQVQRLHVHALFLFYFRCTCMPRVLILSPIDCTNISMRLAASTMTIN